MGPRFIYITTSGKEEAEKIGMELVSSRLAACVNIIDGVRSFYWWEGQVQDDQETIIIAKTREDLVGRLVDKVKSMHSYSCPCVISLPILEGNEDFLNWILKETKSTSQ